MRFKRRREKFRAILEGNVCVHPASVFDPISARIAEDLGFEAGMFAGSVASLTVLGAPDHIVLTLPEFAPQCPRIPRAASSRRAPFAISPVRPPQRFGTLLAATALVALVTDMLLLPVLCSRRRASRLRGSEGCGTCESPP